MRSVRAVESVIGAGRRSIRIGACIAFGRTMTMVLPFCFIGGISYEKNEDRLYHRPGQQLGGGICGNVPGGAQRRAAELSHGTHAEHQQKFDMIHKVRRELELPIAIMLDTKGPEYRIRTFKIRRSR